MANDFFHTGHKSIFHQSGSHDKASPLAEDTAGRSQDSSFSFYKGQTLRGQITNITTQSLTLEFSNGKTLTARYDQTPELSIGDYASFRIMSADEQGIVLHTLQEQGKTSSTVIPTTVLKALDNAALPVNDRNVSMVMTLLRHNMPIHTQMLSTILQQSFRNPDITLPHLVTMNYMGLPITPETTYWFENYCNLEHQLTEQFSDISKELFDILRSLSGGTDPANGTANFANSSPSHLTEETSTISHLTEDASSHLMEGASAPLDFPEEAMKLSVAFANSLLQAPELTSFSLSEQTLSHFDMTALLPEESAGSAGFSDHLPSDAANSSFLPNGMSGDTTADQSNLMENGAMGPETGEVPDGAPAAEHRPVPDPELYDFLSLLKEWNLGSHLSLQDNPPNSDNLLQVIRTILSSDLSLPHAKNGIKDILNHPYFERFTHQLLLNNWTLSPEELFQPGSIKALYKRILGQLDALENAERLIQQTETHKSAVTQAKENLQFMNTLHELYSYVQLPLRMSGGETHGDLYVYTNKRSHSEQDNGRLSCLLHLNMHHLGALDIRVQMNQGQIKTLFYTEDVTSAKLLEKHLPELDEAVARHGISMHTEVVRKSLQSQANSSTEKESSPFLQNLLEEELPSGVHRYSFDVRA